MKEKGGEKANGFRSEPKPSSPYSTVRAPVCDREAHDLVPGMPRGQGVPRPLVPFARLVHRVTPRLIVPVWLKKSSIKGIRELYAWLVTMPFSGALSGTWLPCLVNGAHGSNPVPESRALGRHSLPPCCPNGNVVCGISVRVVCTSTFVIRAFELRLRGLSVGYGTP